MLGTLRISTQSPSSSYNRSHRVPMKSRRLAHGFRSSEGGLRDPLYKLVAIPPAVEKNKLGQKADVFGT